MRLRWTWKLGRIAGIEVGIHPSWLIIYALVVTSAIGFTPLFSPELSHRSTIVLGLVAALVLFASVVAHEFAHALVARRLGIPIGGITLFLFGGVATIESEPNSPADEFRVAIAGPALSIALAIVFGALYAGTMALGWVWGATLCAYLALTNTALAAFNLLPAFPSDGGRVLRSLLWRLNHSQAKATLWASWVSVVFAVLLAVSGGYFVIATHEMRGLWWVVLGLFLWQAAVVSGRRARVDLALERLQVADCMLKTLIPVPANTMVASFIGEVAGSQTAGYPVVDHGALVGLADVRNTSGLPLAMWDRTPVSSVMVPIARVPALSGHESARDALTRLHESGVDGLPVYQDGELIGIVTRDSIFRKLHDGAPVRRSA
jgi:Zn-dependent protease